MKLLTQIICFFIITFVKAEDGGYQDAVIRIESHGKLICFATVLDQNTIVTAASLIEGRNVKNLVAYIANQYYSIHYYRIDPEYNRKTCDHNVVILKLCSPIAVFIRPPLLGDGPIIRQGNVYGYVDSTLGYMLEFGMVIGDVSLCRCSSNVVAYSIDVPPGSNTAVGTPLIYGRYLDAIVYNIKGNNQLSNYCATEIYKSLDWIKSFLSTP